jgi:glycosyltransferase involved in cell wall biosynthesis
VREVAARRCGIGADRCHVIPNGIDPDLLAPDVRSARLVEEPLRVVFLGRLDPIKRVPLLVEAVRRVENVTLDIFGDGEEANRIGRAASGCSRIRMHGFAPREVALREADLLVLPSRAEGFGLVLIEAMAAGVAVVGADVPGIRDVLEPEQRVDLSGDRVGPLVEALVRHRDDPQFDKRVSGRALERLREQTWPTIAGRYRARLGDSGAGPVVCPGA